MYTERDISSFRFFFGVFLQLATFLVANITCPTVYQTVVKCRLLQIHIVDDVQTHFFFLTHMVQYRPIYFFVLSSEWLTS